MALPNGVSNSADSAFTSDATAMVLSCQIGKVLIGDVVLALFGSTDSGSSCRVYSSSTQSLVKIQNLGVEIYAGLV